MRHIEVYKVCKERVLKRQGINEGDGPEDRQIGSSKQIYVWRRAKDLLFLLVGLARSTPYLGSLLLFLIMSRRLSLNKIH